MDLQLSGTITNIFQAEAKTESFTVREFHLLTDGQYGQYIRFQLTNDRCDIIDPFFVNQSVTVLFNINGKKPGEDQKLFNNLTAWKIVSNENR